MLTFRQIPVIFYHKIEKEMMGRLEIITRLRDVIRAVTPKDDFTGDDPLEFSLDEVVKLTMAAEYEFDMRLYPNEGIQLFGRRKTFNEMVEWIYKFLEPFD